jgi:hypothetical protein
LLVEDWLPLNLKPFGTTSKAYIEVIDDRVLNSKNS